MALINTGPDYTRTGESFFSRWSGKLSFLPFIGAPLALGFGAVGTVVETAGWLFRGKFASAATALAAGTVSTGLNSAEGIFSGLSNVRWLVNAGSGVATGNSIGTHGRAATEAVIGSISGVFGARPTVLRSYTAGVGSIGGGAVARPGQFATAEANRRGQDANAMYNNYRTGNSQDYQALVNAQRAQGASAARG